MSAHDQDKRPIAVNHSRLHIPSLRNVQNFYYLYPK